MLSQLFLNKIKFPKEINAFLFPSQKSHTVDGPFDEHDFLSCNGHGWLGKTVR